MKRDLNPELSGLTRPSSGSASERSLRLLELIARHGSAIALADLAKQLGLPKATTHRLCMALMDSGFLVRALDERSFETGPALRSLAFEVLNNGVARGLRHDVLSQLVEQVRETCNFTTLDGTQVFYMDRVEAQWPLRLTLDVGSHVPIHCTASGKMLLASMPLAQREAIISQLQLVALTPQTITKASALKAECAKIEKQGYACDREEFITGLIAVAVPVSDAQGRVRATIAVHAPLLRMSLKSAQAKLPALRAAAARMGALL